MKQLRASTLSLSLFILLMLTGSAGVSDAAGAADCSGKTFELPIEDASYGGQVAPVVWLTVGPLGRSRVMLDSGSAINAALIVSADYRPQLAHAGIPISYFVPELAMNMELRSLQVPPIVGQRLKARDIGLILINPGLINEAGFTVFDIRDRRLIGFAREADVRHCFGTGIRFSRSAVSGDQKIYLQATVDDKDDGQVLVDTGATLSKIYAPDISDPAARADASLTYYDVHGVATIPLISQNHRLQVGPKVKNLSKVSLEPAPIALPGELFPAALGYSDLKDTVMIFAPKSADYWELIF